MIRLRNKDEFPIVLTIPGTLTTTAGYGNKALSAPAPFAGIVKAIYAVEGTAPSGSDVVDIKKNGTEISGSHTLTFASSVAATYVAPSTNPTTVAKGDIFSAVVSSVGGTSAGADFSCAIVIERANSSAKVAATQTDTYGLDSDAIS